MRTLYSLQGERWDQLSYRAFGVSSEEGVMALRDANPHLLGTDLPFTLPAGALVTVPDITLSQTDTVEVAPWQR
ncbi:MAG: tail protein X [Kluyvera sp.]|uniref:tail protein X n=1 Tax=Kluyvera sp. TaxID=1538228 RepID=UPI003A854525